MSIFQSHPSDDFSFPLRVAFTRRQTRLLSSSNVQSCSHLLPASLARQVESTENLFPLPGCSAGLRVPLLCISMTERQPREVLSSPLTATGIPPLFFFHRWSTFPTTDFNSFSGSVLMEQISPVVPPFVSVLCSALAVFFPLDYELSWVNFLLRFRVFFSCSLRLPFQPALLFLTDRRGLVAQRAKIFDDSRLFFPGSPFPSELQQDAKPITNYSLLEAMGVFAQVIRLSSDKDDPFPRSA